MWGLASVVFGAALSIGTAVYQASQAKADTKAVNRQIDDLNRLNTERRELERNDKEQGLKASQRARLASIRNTMGARGLDTEGSRSQNIENVTESSLAGRLDVLNKSADIGNKIDATTSTIQKLQRQGPSTSSVVAGVAGSLLGGTLIDQGVKNMDVSGITTMFDDDDTDTKVDSFSKLA
tara:strand:- start:6340 stop:6879 length:540 start_codon:yes stop_codon:yes gene_type:complete